MKAFIMYLFSSIDTVLFSFQMHAKHLNIDYSNNLSFVYIE